MGAEERREKRAVALTFKQTKLEVISSLAVMSFKMSKEEEKMI